MGVEIVTREDLELLRVHIVSDFRQLLLETKSKQSEQIEGYKTNDVRRILKCSTNKLQSLRIAGKLRYKKVGGTLYYKKDDVRKLLDDGY
jgi:hypothetical protein